MIKYILATILFLASAVLAEQHPNIVIIYADDMGVGDVSFSGGKAATPHIDALAKTGMTFTDAHTTASNCTPSRYGLLTGRYNWRTRLQRRVFNKPTEPPLIKKDEPTIASMLKAKGYHTGIVGKWHLGIGWQLKPEGKRPAKLKGQGWEIDYSKPAVTPTSNGFDYFYGIAASLDMAPYVYIENDKATHIPDVTGGRRKGAAHSSFKANQCLKVFAEKSVNYINQQAKQKQPFLLYLPLTSPHTPIVPSQAWLGKSGIGRYGDFLMETDWVVGEVVKALEENKLSDNTLVIFSTDNGCSTAANYADLAKHGHHPSGPYKGNKADIYEGGHRVPTVMKWPKVIPANSKTSRITTLADCYATFAEIVNAPLQAHEGVDSISFLPSLKDPSQTKRSPIVMYSAFGAFAIREGQWKLCFCSGSAGWSKPKSNKSGPKYQLFDLEKDPAEKQNLFGKHPKVEQHLTDLLKEYISKGRSTDGPVQQNDVPVVIDKGF